MTARASRRVVDSSVAATASDPQKQRCDRQARREPVRPRVPGAHGPAPQFPARRTCGGSHRGYSHPSVRRLALTCRETGVPSNSRATPPGYTTHGQVHRRDDLSKLAGAPSHSWCGCERARTGGNGRTSVYFGSVRGWVWWFGLALGGLLVAACIAETVRLTASGDGSFACWFGGLVGGGVLVLRGTCSGRAGRLSDSS